MMLKILGRPKDPVLDEKPKRPTTPIIEQDAIRISFAALIMILVDLSDKDNPMHIMSCDEEIYFHIKEGNNSGWCCYNTITQQAFHIYDIWKLRINNAIMAAKAKKNEKAEEKQPSRNDFFA